MRLPRPNPILGCIVRSGAEPAAPESGRSGAIEDSHRDHYLHRRRSAPHRAGSALAPRQRQPLLRLQRLQAALSGHPDRRLGARRRSRVRCEQGHCRRGSRLRPRGPRSSHPPPLQLGCCWRGQPVATDSCAGDRSGSHLGRAARQPSRTRPWPGAGDHDDDRYPARGSWRRHAGPGRATGRDGDRADRSRGGRFPRGHLWRSSLAGYASTAWMA